jgi:hypothetical protein
VNLQIDKEELVGGCNEWQINNLKFGSLAKKLSEELNKIYFVTYFSLL